MTRVKLFEIIRRDHHVRGESIRALARKHGVHRRTVRQALTNAVPPQRKPPARSAPQMTPEVCGLIDGWLEADRQAPRKQRHTGRRIHQRLVREHGFTGAASTVRKYVGRRRRELAVGQEVFVPQGYEPGHTAEVDWYEATIQFPEGPRTVYFFAMRSSYSGRTFHVAFPRMTQQAFLEAHVLAFEWFGGVFEVVRYDNLTSAVKKVLRGRRRVETDRFVALRSHYLFTFEFCRPGVGGAHEKGGVEGEVGRFRRSHLVPVPEVADFDDLNARLLADCEADDARRREGHALTVGEEWAQEAAQLRDCPAKDFDTTEVSRVRVDRSARVKVRTNRYSVPVRLAGRKVEVRLHARRVEVVAEGRVVASHPRLQGRHEERLELDHYIELLRVKPGALPASRALLTARREGRWPSEYDTLWDRLKERYDASEAARQLLDVLLLHRKHTGEEVLQAVQAALRHGCVQAGAIAVLLRQQTEVPVAHPLSGLGALDAYGAVARGDLGVYDRLLGGAVLA